MGRRTAALASIMLMSGCASTFGNSGPVAWQAVDATVRGDSRMAVYTCTVVARETAGKNITFTRFTRTASWGWRLDDSVAWRLPAHGELRLPFSWLGICPGVNCSAQKGVTIFWDVVLI